MNDLIRFFDTTEGKIVHKMRYFLEIYDRFFSKYKETDVCILEIGIGYGGSLQMWKDYFGSKAKIYGFDKNDCKRMEEPQIKTIMGMQADKEALKRVKEEIPKIDIIIDDGGHVPSEQVITFKELFPHLDSNGIYVVEDTHTSYRKTSSFDGGYKKQGTFIEFAKDLVDYLYYPEFISNPEFLNKEEIRMFGTTIDAVHFYHYLTLIKKSTMSSLRSPEMKGKVMS